MRFLRPGRDEGAAAVETSLVLPIVVLLIFGIIEFGILFNRLQGVHAASREAARFGSLIGVTVGEIQVKSEDAAPPFVDFDDLQVTVRRLQVLENGTETETGTWTWDPVADTWSGGVATDVPCDESLEPDPDVPSDNTEVASINVRVELELLNPNDYGVTIPLFGSFAFAHPSGAEFRCEY
ncbi:MAG: TadE family protein [Nitriliruptorales bacterium]|nr:TadE family protein [Nitriliruptorales bacterium]